MNNAQFNCYLEGLLLRDIFAIDESTWMKAFNYFIYLYCTIIILSFLRLLIYPFHLWVWHSILRLFSPRLLSFLQTNCGPIPQKRCGCLWVRSRGPSHLWLRTFWTLHYQDIWIKVYNLPGVLVWSETSLGHGSVTSESTSHSVINTSWSSPAGFEFVCIVLRLKSNESLVSFVDDFLVCERLDGH